MAARGRARGCVRPYLNVKSRDPGFVALRRAVRVGLVGPLVFAFLLEVAESPEAATFGAFGSFALLAFAHGFLVAFDGPARAIRCAIELTAGLRALGLDIRAGLHTGEVEVRGDDIGGIAVHTGARIATLARAGEVLVSSTVKDLVAGSGIEFDDRGEHDLKGVPGAWHLFAVKA